ncbi:unnamed protein product [Rotaria magnacalcarata]|nr:unnamed protein product [Rotaria magnacalcarata]
MFVLYSLIDIGIERLDLLAQDITFTNTLNFLSSEADSICSLNDSIVDRFCSDILPRIQCNVQCLIFESILMERILLVTNYPNLTKLKIFNVNQDIVLRYFTNESPFRHIFKQQITNLTVINNDTDVHISTVDYTKDVYVHIFNFFTNLKHLSIAKSSSGMCQGLLLRDLSSTTFSSSILIKLCINVHGIDDCLSLLDGRLENLLTLIVFMDSVKNHSSTMQNLNDLPNLKCFSLRIGSLNYVYDTLIVPLLRRMRNLEELTLDLRISNQTRFVDGTQLHNEILIHMAQLHKFIFYIKTIIQKNNSLPRLSNDDIQRTFTNIGYEQVGCIVENRSILYVNCHVFSLPFAFDRLKLVGTNFPNIIYNNVTVLCVRDSIPFKHEFFVRIARCFPLLKSIFIINHELDLTDQYEIESDLNELYSVIEYPHLKSLDVRFAHICYVKQFLHESNTRILNLAELKIKYHKLQIVTDNFTRQATRLNCMKIKQLTIDKAIVHTKDFHDYFPLL